MKQYNNRWFLFGLNEEYQSLSNLAIDRIIEIIESSKKYKPNLEIDFEDFFEDVVGVSVQTDCPIEKLVISIFNEIWPYIESKPLHGSQKVKSKTGSHVVAELSIQINHELLALLFSYMDGIEILEPEFLRERFKTIAETIFKKYI